VKPLCTGVEHGPPSDPWSRQCSAVAAYRVVDDDLEGFLCARHAKLVRHMYEPGQLTKLRPAKATETKEK
jgi:hypothetical protein